MGKFWVQHWFVAILVILGLTARMLKPPDPIILHAGSDGIEIPGNAP